MSDAECLQCGQTKYQVKRERTFCATVTGHEVVETQDEWSRHHWRDWSDAELTKHGIHPSLWDENRRTNVYDLEFPARVSHCMENGHTHPKPWRPPMAAWKLDAFPADLCLVCYTQTGKTQQEES